MTALAVLLKSTLEKRGWSLRELQRRTDEVAEQLGRSKGVSFTSIQSIARGNTTSPDLLTLKLISMALSQHTTEPRVAMRQLIEAAGYVLDNVAIDQEEDARIRAMLHALRDLDFAEQVASLPVEDQAVVRAFIAVLKLRA